MPEALLGAQEVAPTHEEGGHAVAQAVQGSAGHVGGDRQIGEAVSEGADGEPAAVGQVGGEDPRPKDAAGRQPALPDRVALCPQLGGGSAEGEAPGAAGLGGSELLGGDPPLDAQDPALLITEAERGELPASSPGVGGQAHDQAELFGLVQPGPPVAAVIDGVASGDHRVDRGLQQAGNIVGGEMEPGARSGGAAHAGQGVHIDETFAVRPAKRRAQHPEPPRHHRHRHPAGGPTGHGAAHDRRREGRHPPLGQRVGPQGLHVGAGTDPRRRAPVVIRADPPFEELPHGENRGGSPQGPPLSPLLGQLPATQLRLLAGAVEDERALDAAARHPIEANNDTDLHTPSRRSRSEPSPHPMHEE